MEAAFRRIKHRISDVTQVHAPEQRVGLPHSLQGADRHQPENDGDGQPPPAREAERKATRDHRRDEHELAIPTQQLMGAVRRLVNDNLARLFSGVHGGDTLLQMTAALTPKALESIGAANTRTETTKPIMQALRPSSVSSPPQSIAPPAIAIPIKPIA
jgi:hypothetical protein